MDWNMLNKVTSLLVILCMLFAPMAALADEPEPLVPPNGRITGLRYQQKAPYSGVLLNTVAAARLLTNREYNEEQWKLRLDFELAKQHAELNLTIETQRVSYEALQQKHTTLIQIKDEEIERLSDIASNTNDYSVWWATGGIVVGIGLTLAVVYAVQAGNQ
jgi:hypothetical protein